MKHSTKKTRIVEFSTLSSLIKTGKNVALQSYVKNTDYSCQFVHKSGTTLLHVASEASDDLTTQYILENKLIDIDAQDKNGKTAIMLSLEVPLYAMNLDGKREEVIKIFLNFNANIFIRNNFGKCALQMIFERGLLRSKFTGQLANLIEKGNQTDNKSMASKLTATDCLLPHAMLFRNTEITKLILKKGFSVNTKDLETGDTALHVAVELRDLENVKLLLASGARVDAANKLNRIPCFHYSFDNSVEELEILKILVEQGTLFTTYDKLGNFPIREVLNSGNHEALIILLNSNINLMARDAFQRTPIHHILENEKALRENAEPIIENLRSKAFDANSASERGDTLLIKAVNSGFHEFVKLLLERDADPNLPDMLDWLPLDGAIASDNSYHSPELRHLLGSSCDKQVDKNCYKKCIELLVQYGANIQTIMPNRETIFDEIHRIGNYDAVEPICGQFAILEERGTQISDLIRSKISGSGMFKDEFELCKRQLVELKTTIVHDSMTLYKILSESQKNIALYSRDDDFFFGLTKFNNKYSTNSYYCHLLQSHLEKPIKYAMKRRETIEILSEVMGLNYYSNHIIIDKIIEYVVAGIL